jgi:hypothetical protein
MLALLAVLPSGPLALTADFEGLGETSTSVDEVVTEGGRLTLHSLSRCSNYSAPPEIIEASLPPPGSPGGAHGGAARPRLAT